MKINVHNINNIVGDKNRIVCSCIEHNELCKKVVRKSFCCSNMCKDACKYSSYLENYKNAIFIMFAIDSKCIIIDICTSLKCNEYINYLYDKY